MVVWRGFGDTDLELRVGLEGARSSKLRGGPRKSEGEISEEWTCCIHLKLLCMPRCVLADELESSRGAWGLSAAGLPTPAPLFRGLAGAYPSFSGVRRLWSVPFTVQQDAEVTTALQ